jgi:hypothetical protein
MAGIAGKGGIKGRSGPPGNQNALRYGLAAIEKRQDTGLLAPLDESIRREILDGLLSDKGGESQVNTATGFENIRTMGSPGQVSRGRNHVQPLEKIGGADGSRTHDLLNAIIPTLSRASYSWKKYPAFLTVKGQQFFRLYQVLS